MKRGKKIMYSMDIQTQCELIIENYRKVILIALGLVFYKYAEMQGFFNLFNEVF